MSTKKYIVIHQYINPDGSAGLTFEMQFWNDRDSMIGAFQVNFEMMTRMQKAFLSSNKRFTFQELESI